MEAPHVSVSLIRHSDGPLGCLTLRITYDTFTANSEPYSEWWRDRPFEATATGSQRNAGANSNPRDAGGKIR